MKPKYLFLLVLLASCQKEKTAPKATAVSKNETETVIASKAIFLKTDTIKISDGDDSYSKNYILANLVSQNVDKDSIVTSQYQLDFYQAEAKTASSKVEIKNNEKGSEWYANFGLSSQSSKESPFIQISYGYPACGYVHDNYLYYLKNNDLQLVYQWFTMSDSGWGNWVEFTNKTGDPDPKSFYCKNVAFEPTDDGNEDSGIVTYSDSTSFELKGNKWTKKLLSVKDKNYFEKKMSFNDFHKVK